MSSLTRPDIYTKVHRGLRKGLFELAIDFGRTDFRNDAEVAALQSKADEVIHFLMEHGHKEDAFFLAPLEAKVPGSTAHDSAEHVVIEQRIEELKKAFEELGEMPVEKRVIEGEKLYFVYNRFISDYLIHMDEEEQQTTRLFYEHCTDDELHGMTAALMANIPPADMMMMLGYMIPSIDATTRIEWMREVKPNVPEGAFTGIMGIARQTLSPEAYAKFEQEVG